MRTRRCVRLLAYVTSSVTRSFCCGNEYLAAENRILRAKLPSRLRLSNQERTTLAEIGKRLERKALREVACVAEPATILAWYRRLVAQKFEGPKHRQYPGRTPVLQKWKPWSSRWRARTPFLYCFVKGLGRLAPAGP